MYSRFGLQGSTGVGTVKSVGVGVGHLKVSDTVYIYSKNGAWSSSQDITAPSSQVFKTNAKPGLFHSALTCWAMLNRIPLTKTATTTVMVDTLKTTMGSVLKQVAKELKIDLIEFDAKKENKADVVLCIDANTTAKTLLRSVSKGGSLVMCNTIHPMQYKSHIAHQYSMISTLWGSI